MHIHCNDRARRMAAVALAAWIAAPVLAQGSGAAGGASGGSGANGAASAPAGVPYFAAVNANNVFVRSSPSVQSSYPFGRLAAGDVVEVLEESYGWARVRCSGPVFASIQGYVPADRRVELSADGGTLKVTAKSEVKAANIGSKGSPDASWKPIAKLAAGDVLTVLGTMEGEREKVYTVALPASAEGFVNLNYLRRASAAEVEASKSPKAAPSAGTGNTLAAAPKLKASPVSKTPANGANPSKPNAQANSRTNAAPDSAPSSASADEGGETVEILNTKITEKPDGTVTVKARDEVVTLPKRDEEPPVSKAGMESAANRAEFSDLESIWETVKKEPIEDAELSVLRGRYADLMTRPNVAGDIRQMSKARMEQLSLKMEVQTRMQTLERLRSQRNQDLEHMRAIAIAMEARSDYDAIGVLNASTVFDGKRLPALYRLQDPVVGQVVAYVVPQDNFQLGTMLGVLVGIKGQKRYDESLRVNVIEPRSVNILTQRRDPQVVDPNAPASGSSGGSGTTATSGAAPALSSAPTPNPSTVEYAPVPPDAP